MAHAPQPENQSSKTLGPAPSSIDRTVVWLSVLASLVLVNVVGLAYFSRIDLTSSHEFTLSQASQKALASLKEPITIRAYFSRDLPPPHNTQARYVKDLLDSYFTQAHGKLRFEFIDPLASATSAETDRKNQLKQDVFGNTVREQTQMERDLEGMGIPPVQVRVNQADKVEVKRAYMGLALHYQGRREVIPVVTDTNGLEYDITSLIRKVSHEQARKIAIVTGHGGTDVDKEMSQGLTALREHYELGKVDLREANTLMPDADALLVVGPATPFDANELRTIDAFVHAGHSVAFFLPPVRTSLQGLTFSKNDHGLDALLGRLGIGLKPGLALDAQCATINVQQQQGFMRVNQPVRYPFIAQAEAMAASPVTRGLGGLLLPFMGALSVDLPRDSAVHAEVLARTSAQSWLQPEPYNLDPMQKWTPDRSQLGAQDLVVALHGPMGRIVPVNGDAPAANPPTGNARVLVAAGDAMLLDPYIGKSNQALLLNMVDWLLGDDDLLAVRSRGMTAAPLADVGEARRRTVKYGNIVGLPCGFVLFGLLRWRRRQARRTQMFV